MADYEYMKKKYKTVTLKLDREADKDVIDFLDQWPNGPKHAVMLAVRIFKKAIKGGLGG